MVGGGVAGLAATTAFATAGFHTICVDPAPPVEKEADPGSDLRSTAFLMPSVRLLESAGLWERLVPFAAPLRIMRLADAGDSQNAVREFADFEAAEAGEKVFGYNVPNWLMRREMAARIAEVEGAELIAPARFESLTSRSDKAIVRLAGAGLVRARLVVAADGRDSAVREAIGVGVRRWSYGQKALVFAVGHERPHEDVSTEIHRSGGPFTLVPLPDRDGTHRSAVVWMETGPRAVALAEAPVPDFEEALNARSCGVLGRLTLESPRRIWPIITQIADRLTGPRTALVAEAAHVIPPIGAQGLNMSLRDVAALRDLCREARAADGDIGAPELLARYGRARRPDMLARVAAVDALNRAAIAENPMLRALRRLGLRALHGAAPVRRGAIRLGLGAGAPAPLDKRAVVP